MIGGGRPTFGAPLQPPGIVAVHGRGRTARSGNHDFPTFVAGGGGGSQVVEVVVLGNVGRIGIKAGLRRDAKGKGIAPVRAASVDEVDVLDPAIRRRAFVEALACLSQAYIDRPGRLVPGCRARGLEHSVSICSVDEVNGRGVTSGGGQSAFDMAYLVEGRVRHGVAVPDYHVSVAIVRIG